MDQANVTPTELKWLLVSDMHLVQNPKVAIVEHRVYDSIGQQTVALLWNQDPGSLAHHMGQTIQLRLASTIAWHVASSWRLGVREKPTGFRLLEHKGTFVAGHQAHVHPCWPSLPSK